MYHPQLIRILETCLKSKGRWGSQQFKRLLFLMAIWIGLANSPMLFNLNAEVIYYQDIDHRLIYSLDTSTKEASVGVEDLSSNYTALLSPGLGDPDWDTDYGTVWNNIEIPETIEYNSENYIVTSVAANAFYKSTDVQTVSLPSTIKSIGSNAFGYCVNLVNFKFPSDLEQISTEAFMLCRKLTEIILPSKVKRIGGGAFRDCVAVTEVFIPASCTIVENEAFNWCTGIRKIVIEDSPETLTMGCCFSRGIAYEGTAGNCQRGMFGDAERLNEIHWGRNLALVSGKDEYVYAPFSYTTNFYSNTSGVQAKSTRNIRKLTFGEFVTEIPRNAFQKGSITMQVVLPPNLRTISDEAFDHTFLENTKIINFPSSLEYIGNRAFEGPNGVEFKIILSDALTPPVVAGYPFGVHNEDILISVSPGRGDTYRQDFFWGKYVIMDSHDETITVNVKTAGTLYGRFLAQGAQLETVKRLNVKGTLNDDDWSSIKQMSCLYDLNIEETEIEEIAAGMIPKSVCYLRLPKKLKRIEEKALLNIPIMGVLEIPESCTYIGPFGVGMVLVDNLILPDNGIEISENAFAFLSNLNEVRLGNVNITGDYAFWSAPLTKVVLGDGCNITGRGVFSGCKSLEIIEIEGIVKNIGAYAFDTYLDCEESPIKNIVFNGCVLNTGENLFFNSDKNPYPVWSLHIKDLEGYIKSSFTGVGSSFMYFAKEMDYNGMPLTSLAMPEGISAVSDGLLTNCSSLTQITLPSTLKKIGESAFEGCPIGEVVLPDSLQVIAKNAFKDCSNFEELKLPKSIIEIGSGAFNDCRALKNVYSFKLDPVVLTTSDKWADDYPFSGVQSDCCLHIPIGTAAKYRNANWLIPKYQENGILSIKIQGKGNVVYNGTTISPDVSELLFTPYVPIEVLMEPVDGNVLKSVVVNGENITDTLSDNCLIFDDPDSDMSITITFSEPYTTGDSNNDGQIDIADAVNIANHIIGLSTTNFNFAASDINEDDNITVSDVTSTVTLIQRQSYIEPSMGVRSIHIDNEMCGEGFLTCGEIGNNIYSFGIDDDNDLTALQFDIRAGGLDMSGIMISESLAESHTLKLNRIDESTVRVILFSATSEPLPLNQTLVTLNSTRNKTLPWISNIFASDSSGKSKKLRFGLNTSGLSDINTDNVEVYGADKGIIVANAIGQKIAIYTSNGICISRQKAFENNIKIDVEKGVYIVLVGECPFKVIVK